MAYPTQSARGVGKPVGMPGGMTRGVVADPLGISSNRVAAGPAQMPAQMPASMAAIAPQAPVDTYDRDTQREDFLRRDARDYAEKQSSDARFYQNQDEAKNRELGLRDEERMWGRIKPYIDMISKPVDFSSSSYGAGAGGALPGSPSEASELAFALAKDRAGLLARARNKDIRDTFVNSGFTASGETDRQASQVIDDTGNYLSNVATAQAENEANRAAQVEDRNFQASTAMRQSNLSLLPSILALMRTSRAY